MSPTSPDPAFTVAASPMQLTYYLGPPQEEEPTEYLAIMEFSGNGFTFDIRKKDQYRTKSDDIDRIKIKLPNSADIRSRPDRDIRPKSIKEIKRQLHYIRGMINQLMHHGNTVYMKAIGTAALRDASNTDEITEAIAEQIGNQIAFEVIEGDIEAALCAHGITLFYPDVTGLVVDMGGGSTEFARLKNGLIKKTKSLGFGTSSVNGADNANGFVDEALDLLPKKMKQADTVFLSGGTFRNINKTLCAEKGWDIMAEEPPRTSLRDYQAYIEKLMNFNEEEWAELPESLQNRKEFLKAALVVVKRLIKTLPDDADVALTKTKTRDGLFRLMHEMLEEPALNPEASVNVAFSDLSKS